MPTEPTLLKQLDDAEARLVHAEGRHAHITAARCAVAVEEAPDAD